MLGRDGRLYDPMYDFDEDGKLDVYEEAVAFDEYDRQLDDEADSSDDYEDEEDELEEALELAGLDRYDLEGMDEDERREALEDAGLDPDDYDDF